MANITIRNLDNPLKMRLRVRATRHGCSMEEEAHQILQAVLTEEHQPTQNLGQAIQRRFAPFGGVDLPERVQDLLREPTSFD